MERNKSLRAAVAIWALSLTLSPASPARTLYVDDDAPADFRTIQAAIDAAGDGDTIIVHPGTYTGPGNRDISFQGKAVVVRSEQGAQTCIIDCQGSINEPHRGFHFHSGEDANSVVQGFTITGGFARGDDSITAAGGGILCDAGSPRIADCIITGNVAVSGGGIACLDSNAIIANCVVSGNHATASWKWGYSVSRTHIGGGIRLDGPHPMLINCLVVGNRASGDGGGISCRGTFTLFNSTISGNRSDCSGGGICINGRKGGERGILRNCILWDNTSRWQCPQVGHAVLTLARRAMGLNLSGCTIQDSDLSCVYGLTGNWTSVEPLFATPGYWDPNGTPDDPDDDFWVNGDYHLKSQAGRWDPVRESWVIDDVTSPGIDAGDPNSPIGDEPEPHGGRVNMGAYAGTLEASKSYFPDATRTRIIHVDDDAPGTNDGSSWVNAYRHLQDALADVSAAEVPVEVRVAGGIYKPDQGASIIRGDREATFCLTGGVTLRGGYAGVGASDPNARDVGLYETILSGDLEDNDVPGVHPLDLLTDPTRADNSQTIMTMAGNAYFPGVLEGFTINSAKGRSALVVSLPHASIRDCTFTDNASGAVALNLGGARPEFTNCRFLRNAATEGGAICTIGGYGYPDPLTITMSGCTFRENHAVDVGGALLLRAFNPSLIEDCIFARNSALYGGAACLDAEKTVNMANCLFVGNRAAERGGGVYLRGLNLHGVCCTFVGNRARDERALASLREPSILRTATLTSTILRDGDRDASIPPTATVTSTILRDGNYLGRPGGSRATVTYSNIERGWPGEGNIDLDPLFSDAGHWDSNGTPDDPNDDFFIEGDYHLKSQAGRWDPVSESWVKDGVTSPCIDAGDPNSPVGLEPFPNGGRVNMGVYGGTAEASKSYFLP